MQCIATKRTHTAKQEDIFGAILTNKTIIKEVMSLAAKAELGALYLNAKEAAYLHQILNKMEHPQPRMPIQTDNTTAERVINDDKIQPKCTKVMDMWYHWLRDYKASLYYKGVLDKLAYKSSRSEFLQRKNLNFPPEGFQRNNY